MYLLLFNRRMLSFLTSAIANNILNAVHKSRRTLLVLSPCYVQGEWTRFEYQVAQHQMLKLKHRIIPIIFSDISKVQPHKKNKPILPMGILYFCWSKSWGPSYGTKSIPTKAVPKSILMHVNSEWEEGREPEKCTNLDRSIRFGRQNGTHEIFYHQSISTLLYSP